MSEQARQDALQARIDVHTNVNIHGYFHDHITGQPNPEAYMRGMVADVSKDTELNDLLDTLDSAKTVFESDQSLLELRLERNKILKETDFTVLIDAPLTAQEKTNYQNYRTYLRDITGESPLPSSVDDFDAWLSNQ